MSRWADSINQFLDGTEGQSANEVRRQLGQPPLEADAPLDPGLVAYLDWPLYFVDSSSPYCNKFPACTNPECCDPDSGSVPIATGRRMTVREFLADIKAHAEGR